MYIRELTPDDAPAVAKIEGLLHHNSLTDGAAAHRSFLSEALEQSVNLSFGAFEKGRLVGYLLCYGFEPTAFEGEEGRALYVEDLAVLPECRAVLPLLLRRFMRDVDRYFPLETIEAHAVESIVEYAREHDKMLSRYGLALDRHMKTGELVAGQPRYMLRWRRVRRQTKSVNHLLERLPRQSVEVDGRAYQIAVVRREADWPLLSAIWDRLLLATRDHTVFQSFLYQRLWWRHFADGDELHIVLIVDDGEVVGIAPLRINTVRYGLRCRTLCFIGTRWEVDRPAFLFPEREAVALTRVLAAFLARRTGQWDICDFHEQPTDSAELKTLATELKAAGYFVDLARDSDCPYLVTQGSWRDFLAGKSQKFRKNIKAAERKLRELGDLKYRMYDSSPEVVSQLENYRALESRSWKQEAGVGVGRDDSYFAFYRDLAETFGAHGAFVVRTLTLGDRCVAATFGLEFDQTYYSLQIVHDREFDRCSPGTFLEAVEIEDCFVSGNREYEFLGGFLNNKSRWTDSYRQTTHLRVYRRSLVFGTLYFVLCRLKPWVKEIIRPYMKSWDQNRMENV
jgi:CelD/BcsL family acetyltransferase involved in cellulose biosynthesis